MATEQIIDQSAPATLLDLPVELSLKITALVPDTDALSLTCKKFYNFVLLCDASKKYKINIKHEDLLLDFPTFCHILNSTRVFDLIEFSVSSTANELFWMRLERIITSRTFSSLTVNNTRSKGSDPQLTEILTKSVRADSLKELNLIGVDLKTVRNFFSRQRSIKALSITGSINVTSVEFISHLDLKSLTLSLTGGSDEVLAVIKSQPKLTKLIFECSDDISNTSDLISHESLLNLEELKLPTAFKDFAPLARFKKLKKWTVVFNSSIPPIPSLEELNLTVDEHTTTQDFVQLSEKLRNLKVLTVKGILAINCLVECTSNFHKLETISVVNHKAIYCKIANFPTLESSFNLKHLRIVNQDPKVVIYSADLIRFLKSFEGLRTVWIETLSEVSSDNLRHLLVSLPNIRELAIDICQRCSSIETFRQLASELHGGKIELIKFLNFRSDCDEDDIRTVFGNIFPIIEKREQNLILRKHGRFRLLKPSTDHLQ